MATYAMDAADKMLKRYAVFTAGSTNFFSKSGGVNGAWDSAVMSNKWCLTASDDQSGRFLTKNVTKGVIFGWSNFTNPNFDSLIFAIQVVTTTKAINVWENGVQVGGSYGTANEDSEFRIQQVLVSGVLKTKYLWRPHAGDPETLMYTSTATGVYSTTDAYIRHCHPMTIKVCFLNNDGATTADNSAMETMTLEADADKVGDYLTPDCTVNAHQFAGVRLRVKSGDIDMEIKDLPNHELKYSGSNLITSTNGIFVFKAMKDWGKITGVKISVLGENKNTAGACEFNIKQNGDYIFEAHELTIPINQASVSVEDLTIDVAEDDEFIVNYITPGRTVKTPIFLEIELEVA